MDNHIHPPQRPEEKKIASVQVPCRGDLGVLFSSSSSIRSDVNQIFYCDLFRIHWSGLKGTIA
jgi:hypothetical protein